MKPRRAFTLVLPLLLALLAAGATAQGIVPDAPRLSELRPPSAARGQTVEVILAGQKLAGTRELLCRYSPLPGAIPPAERGIQAEVLEAADRQLRARLTIAADAPPGLHQIRAVTARGITDPVPFFVSLYPQTPEKEPNNTPAAANRVSVPVTIAGVIDPGEDRDCFTFPARQGETLLFEVEGFKRYAPPQNSQTGIVYLDSLLTLHDASGRELAWDDDSSRLDSFLAYRFPADGNYTVAVRDALYRGRGDFHYRLTIGRHPHITAIYPAGGQAGTALTLTVFGYNLDESGATSVRRSIRLPQRPGVQEFRLPAGGPGAPVSNAVPLAVGSLLEVNEQEPNDRIYAGTPATLPVVFNGQFDRIGDVDGFRFQAQAGQVLVVSVQAARLGSQADTFLTLMDRSGRVVKQDDDGSGTPDAHMEATIPQTDEYVVFVRDQLKTGCGPSYFYRLTVRPREPALTVTIRRQGVDAQGRPAMVPVDSLAVPQGGATEFELALGRLEGQSGEVTAELSAPPGVSGIRLEQTLPPTPQEIEAAKKAGRPEPRPQVVNRIVVRNGQNSVRARLVAAPDAPLATHRNVYLRVTGLLGAQPHTIDHPFWVTVAPRDGAGP